MKYPGPPAALTPGRVGNPLPDPPSWTFLTNHAHVLICIALDPDLRLRDVAGRVGITERATQRIVHDLVEGGYVTRRKVGRRNSYRLRLEQPMRHPVESGHAIRDLVAALSDEADAAMRGAAGHGGA
jgi:DNA-binding IclR family transcriptional regulator